MNATNSWHQIMLGGIIHLKEYKIPEGFWGYYVWFLPIVIHTNLFFFLNRSYNVLFRCYNWKRVEMTLKWAIRLLQSLHKRLHEEYTFDPEAKEANGKCHGLLNGEILMQLPDSAVVGF
jgi:hypothetical protein